MQAIATDSPNEATRFVCQELHIPYFRFNPILPEKVDLKEVRTERLVKLILDTKRYLSEMSICDELSHLVQLLHAASKANQSDAMYRATITSPTSKE